MEKTLARSRRSVPGGTMTAPIDTPEWWARAIALAEKATTGDTRAASDLTAHVRPWVFRLAARQFPYRGDADDVTQDVCIAVFRTIDRLRHPDRLRSWLASVTLNEVRRFYRHRTRDAERIQRAAAASPPTAAAPERTSVLGGFRVDFLDTIEQLPSHKAFALGLRQLGLSYDEIAGEMSLPERMDQLLPDRSDPVPVGTAKRWVSEARTVMEEGMGQR